MQTSKPVKHTVTVNAPAKRVFDALTRETELTRWFPSRAKVDLQVGGRYAFEFVHDAARTAQNHERTGEIRELTPGHRLAYTWKIPEYSATTLVTWSLAEENGVTTLTLEHTGWASDDETRGMHEQGWGFFLQNLKGVLEGGKDTRAEALGLQAPTA